MINLKLPGQLVAVYDARMAFESARNGCPVIYVGDPMGSGQYQNQYISGMALIPRVDAMQALVNGDGKTFTNIYMQQLYSDPVIHEFLDTIVCALFEGQVVVLYVPEEAVNFGYHETLFRFIQNVYGLFVQRDANNPYYQEPGFISVIDALYNYRLIDNASYLAYVPDPKMNDLGFIQHRLCPMFGIVYDENGVNYLRYWKMCMEKNNKPLHQVIDFVKGSE